MEKGEGKMTYVPRPLRHNQQYCQFPTGIPNNFPFPVRTLSLHSLVHPSSTKLIIPERLVLVYKDRAKFLERLISKGMAL